MAEDALVWATLCAWFASSLAGTPVSTRVARRVHPRTPDMQAYTVRLTRGWALYFALMAALSLLVFALLGLPAWASLGLLYRGAVAALAGELFDRRAPAALPLAPGVRPRLIAPHHPHLARGRRLRRRADQNRWRSPIP